MSVQDIRFKLILCLCMIFPPLLLSYSHAFPDLYFYNNFLTGMSPYTYNGTSIDNEGVTFYPNEGENNNYTGIVTSFSQQFMHGTADPSAIPFLNLDYTKGKIWELPSNSCVVVGSISGDIANLYHTAVSGGNLNVITLGMNSPKVASYTGNAILSHNNWLRSSAGETGSDYTLLKTNTVQMINTMRNLDDFFLYADVSNLATSSIQLNTTAYNRNIGYYRLLYNSSPSPIKFSVDGSDYLSTHTEITYTAPFMSAEHFTGIIYAYNYYTSNTSEITTLYTFLPHIEGTMDIYSIAYNGFSQSDLETKASYELDAVYSLDMELYETAEGYVVCAIGNGHNAGERQRVYSQCTLHLADKDNTLMPVFLNYPSIYYLYNKALYIKGGYISIDNYDDLVAKLQEAGIGQADLSRVIALLEEINTGGATGQATKQLMDILEQYHGVIVQQGDDDWATINQQFNAFKYLLDFSGDTIHWIVIANNMLFNYFSGFIILCAFFLVINRILR